MSYEQDLIFGLRIRGVSDDEITQTLGDVRAHEAASGTFAESEFGTPQAYSKRFAKRKMRSQGSVITAIAAALAIGYAAVAMILLPPWGINVSDVVGPLELWPALMLILVGVLNGFLTDYFRPLPHSRTAG